MISLSQVRWNFIFYLRKDFEEGFSIRINDEVYFYLDLSIDSRSCNRNLCLEFSRLLFNLFDFCNLRWYDSGKLSRTNQTSENKEIFDFLLTFWFLNAEITIVLLRMRSSLYGCESGYLPLEDLLKLMAVLNCSWNLRLLIIINFLVFRILSGNFEKAWGGIIREKGAKDILLRCSKTWLIKLEDWLLFSWRDLLLELINWTTIQVIVKVKETLHYNFISISELLLKFQSSSRVQRI
jgi:hypothetical protein